MNDWWMNEWVNEYLKWLVFRTRLGNHSLTMDTHYWVCLKHLMVNNGAQGECQSRETWGWCNQGLGEGACVSEFIQCSIRNIRMTWNTGHALDVNLFPMYGLGIPKHWAGQANLGLFLSVLFWIILHPPPPLQETDWLKESVSEKSILITQWIHYKTFKNDLKMITGLCQWLWPVLVFLSWVSPLPGLR